MIDALRQDLRHGVRHLARSPGFTAVALVTLAFGIGVNTAMFSLLNGLVLRPLPLKDPYGLIAISGRSAEGQLQLTPIPALEVLARDGSPLREVCAHNGNALLSIAANGATTQAVGALVTGGCFETFGVSPVVGRTITNADAPLFTRGNLVAVISHRLWMRMFGGDPSAIGKPIGVEGVELTVIGVMPEGFVGIYADSGIDLYTPYDTWSPARIDRRPAASYFLGRLRPGVTLEQASHQLAALWPSMLEEVVPSTVPAVERRAMITATPRIERLAQGISFVRERYERSVRLMFGLTAILLLLTCLNLGGLILSRAVERAPEMATRIALGADRWRLARQVVLENVMLSIGGAALAVPAALGMVAVIVSFLPASTTGRMMVFRPDAFVLAMTAAASLGAGLLMSLLPIRLTPRSVATISGGSARAVAGGAGTWMRGLLVIQIGLSIALAVGAGVLGRSLQLLSNVDLGVHQEGVLIARLQPVPGGYRDLDNAVYYPPMLDRIAGLTGVRSVAQGRAFTRITGDFFGEPIAFVGDEARDARATWEVVSPAYFETLGIPVLSGRVTSWADNERSRPVAVVSERLARSLAPDGNVVGRRVRMGTVRQNQDVEIVGVVGNATLGNPRQPDVPVLYRPVLQSARLANYPVLLIRTDSTPAAMTAAVRQIVADGKHEFLVDVEPLETVLARAPSSELMSATLAITVAALAVTLSFTGVFALLAYSVTRRTREIGVRSALGAEQAAVIWMVMREGLVLTATGVLFGLPIAYFGGRVLGTLTYGISPADPLTFAISALVFVALGVAAGIVPALRAARVDPVIALRAE